MTDVPETIVVTEEPIDIPVAEILTGRGFITGKSGSGKSNTASVIAEELLEIGLPLLIVDTDGEYFGLQERYEILHASTDDRGDMAVGPDDAERLAGLALDGNVPIILDLSDFVDPSEGKELVTRVLREIFRMEDARRKPFLIVIEEIHEYLPEQGAHGQLGELLVQIAKRGRKRGLGLCGISQRPAAVDKDFITQCDWLVWHRLTWQNDTNVVRQLLGADAAKDIQDLNDGEAFLMTDWDDSIAKVHFRRKRTLDAGATPDLASFAGGPSETLEADVLEAISIEDINEHPPEVDDPDVRAQQQLINRLQRRVEELETELDRVHEERSQEVTIESTRNDEVGQLAHGLTELGSLAAHTVRSIYGRIRLTVNGLRRRLATGSRELERAR